MVVRAQRHGDQVDGLYWGCRRDLVCNGTRRIRDPNVIVPLAHDAGTMAIFEWERSRDRRGWARPEEPPANRGFFGRFGRAMGRPTASQASAQAFDRQQDSPLDGLLDYGFVILDDRRVVSARAKVDHLVVGPTGIFVVDRKSWTGQLSASTDSIYVDGHQRTGATDDVSRATAAVEQVLSHELKPLGATIRGAISFDGASNRSFEAAAGKFLLGGSRSLAKQIRAGQETLGPETVVRLSLAADRLLD
jgi:hypothetical protein